MFESTIPHLTTLNVYEFCHKKILEIEINIYGVTYNLMLKSHDKKEKKPNNSKFGQEGQPQIVLITDNPN